MLSGNVKCNMYVCIGLSLTFVDFCSHYEIYYVEFIDLL